MVVYLGTSESGHVEGRDHRYDAFYSDCETCSYEKLILRRETLLGVFHELLLPPNYKKAAKMSVLTNCASFKTLEYLHMKPLLSKWPLLGFAGRGSQLLVPCAQELVTWEQKAYQVEPVSDEYPKLSGRTVDERLVVEECRFNSLHDHLKWAVTSSILWME